jgi:hypothetical protein
MRLRMRVGVLTFLMKVRGIPLEWECVLPEETFESVTIALPHKTRSLTHSQILFFQEPLAQVREVVVRESGLLAPRIP